jgi:zinc transport system permease protein
MNLSLLSLLLVPWLAGIGLSVITSGMGCMLVWRRLSFFGDALAHSTLLGVAISLLLNVSLFVGIVVICAIVGMILSSPIKQSRIGYDTVLAILSYGSLALGMVLMSKIADGRIDPSSYLFGDILTVTYYDLGIIGVAALLISLFLYHHWRSLLLITLNADLAQAEGINVQSLQRQFTCMLAITVAACLKLIGALLVPALLIIPAATASPLARSPKSMIIMTFLAAAISISLGLVLSVYFNTPSGPMIVVTALGLLILSWVRQKLDS